MAERGNNDECVWCPGYNGGYWDCGPPPHCQSFWEEEKVLKPGWVLAGRVTLEAGRYEILCKRGECRVVLVPEAS